DLDALFHAGGVDGRDVQPREGEEVPDAFRLEHAHQELRAATGPHVASLRLELAHRDPARRATRRALDVRLERRTAFEEHTLRARGLERQHEMRELLAGGERLVGGPRAGG